MARHGRSCSTHVVRLLVGCVAAAFMLPVIAGCGLGAREPRVESRPIPEPPPKRVHIAAAGDVMLDRGVWNQIKENGISHVMADVRDRLRAADITFVNLECPLSTAQGHARPGGSLEFCADPGTVQALLDGGVDVVGAANNHGLDAGTQGCQDTMAVLEENHIAYAGARPNDFDADDITYLQAGDTLVAFLAYTDLDFVHGSMCKVDGDMRNALMRVKEARNKADVVCVSYHWGVEYEKTPTDRQRELGHATIDAGADIVLGHHPHVMSGVEWHDGGLILYSMGNFIFDQRDAPDGRMNSAIFNLHVTVGKRIDLVITPVRIQRPEFAPRIATEERGTAILNELAELSAYLGTELVVDGQKARGSFVRSDTAIPETAETEASQPS